MILVTTGGKVGSEVARLLTQRQVVLVRNPDKVKALSDAGAEIAVGDLDGPASIDAAMAGVTSVVLVSPAVPAQELNVVASAARAVVGHVVKATSKASATAETESTAPSAGSSPLSPPARRIRWPTPFWLTTTGATAGAV